MSNDSLTPAEKLRLALEMHDLGVEMMRENLRRQLGNPKELGELQRRLGEWLQTRPGAEKGDGPDDMSVTR